MKYIINKNSNILIYAVAVENHNFNEENFELIETDELPIHTINVWTGNGWEETATEEEIQEANKVKVPEIVTAIQFLTQLNLEGISEDMILGVINTLGEPLRTKALISFKRATLFERNNAIISLLAMGFNKTEVQLDEIFTNASNI